MSIGATIVILFAVATLVAMLARPLRMPYTVALVVAGLVLGGTGVVHPPHLTKELLFALFLPGLLFEASFNLDRKDFWENKLAIGALAVPGVLIGTAITAALVTFAIRATGVSSEFGWRHGLVFGAVVSATDPIAVVALFRRLHAPERLRVLIEGESLVNDGTAIVVLTLILAFVSGAATSVLSLGGRFVAIVGGGAIIGAAIGAAAAWLILRETDPMIEIALTAIAAWSSFLLGERIGYSGVIATVTAGVICGSAGRRGALSEAGTAAVASFWEFVAFLLNSLVFLLIGFEAQVGPLAQSWPIIAIAFVAVLAARAAIVAGVAASLRSSAEAIPRKWAVALTWGGLRGALSMVLALALPADMPQRELLVTMTTGFVVASILVQGLGMPLVLRLLDLKGRTAH